MATFWERATGFGVDPSEMLDLDVFVAGFTLWGRDRMTRSAATAWMGLTPEQADELQEFIYTMYPQTPEAWFTFSNDIRMTLMAARAGLAAFDSIANVWASIGYEPPT